MILHHILEIICDATVILYNTLSLQLNSMSVQQH